MEEAKVEVIEGDFFDRQILIKKLTKYIDLLKNGAVIAIDAPWGTGKTWFGEKWKNYLEKEEHKVIFIDAFKQDYIEDPFLLIAAEINMLSKDDNEAASLRKEAVAVTQYLFPIGAKILLNGFGRFILGTNELDKGFQEIVKKINEQVSDDAKQWIAKKFEYYDQEKNSFSNYIRELKRFCQAEKKTSCYYYR